jgi:hypothetical protein
MFAIAHGLKKFGLRDNCRFLRERRYDKQRKIGSHHKKHLII